MDNALFSIGTILFTGALLALTVLAVLIAVAVVLAGRDGKGMGKR